MAHGVGAIYTINPKNGSGLSYSSWAHMETTDSNHYSHGAVQRWERIANELMFLTLFK